MGKLALFKFAYFVSVVLTFALMIVSILGGLAGHVHPKQNLFITYLGLTLPVLLILCGIMFVYWLCRRKWWTLFPLLALLCNIPFLSSVFQISGGETEPADRPLRVMTLNVRGFVDDNQDDSADNILTYLEQEEVQVVCFQEYSDFVSGRSEKISKYLNSLFPHQALSGSIAIFSKHPIVKKDYLTFRDTNNGAQWVDLEIDRQKVRIINLHLQTTGVNSALRQAAKYEENGANISNTEKADMVADRMGYEFFRRAEQADMIYDLVKQTPHPVIVCGDLNDTPASYTYRRVKGDLEDGFHTAGKGYMYTYKGAKGMIRIDYIFHSPALKAHQYYSDSQIWSDHNPVVMEVDLAIKK